MSFRATHILKYERTTQRSPIAGLGIQTGGVPKILMLVDLPLTL